MATTPFAHDSKERHEDKPGSARGSRRRRRTAAAAVLALLVAGLYAPQIVNAPPANAFGTINGLGQRAEHERITRAALACAPGVKSDGSCFEPHSIDQLAGHSGTFGAVGAPDLDESGDPNAHCDDADFLNVTGYPQSRAAATAQLQGCVDHLRQRFTQGVSAAAGLLDSSGELIPGEADVSFDCTFGGGVSGRAKCNAIEGLGRALHGAQDFYSHSNWADQSDPTKPISVTNPPGLNLPGPSPILDLAGSGPISVPTDLTTGFYAGIFSDNCPGKSGRITHACLNKDKALIDPTTGTATDPRTPRGQVLDNEQKAVSGAIAETQRQWADFRNAIISQYGSDNGQRMILAITQDIPKVDVVFAIDTTGSMSPYIASAVSAANSILDDLSGRGTPARLTDYRIGLVDYKDVDSTIPGCPPDYDAVIDLNFATKRTDVINALGTLPGKVGGGCDIPEDVLSGVNTAVGFPWRPGVSKAIIVMGDAPGHDPEAHSGLTSASVMAAANAVDPASVYPILVGFDPSATSFMTQLATGTGGQTFDSNAPGGVGGALIDAITAIASAPPGGDTTPPTVTVNLPTAPDSQSGVFNASQAPVTGTVTATDASGVSAIDCTDSGGAVTEGPLAIDASGNASRTLTVTGDGQHIVQCGATDGSATKNTGAADGSDSAAALEIDTTAPTVGCSVAPTELTPADGGLVTVDANVMVGDAFSGPAGFTLTAVTSSEPNNDNSIQGFDVGTADTEGQLRAESTSAAGRVYTLTYQGADAAGNTATCQATVTVPPKPGGIGVDTMVNTTIDKSTGQLASAPVSTGAGNELLLAFVSSDGPDGKTQQVTKVTGGGLTWSLAARANGTKGTGTAEVWQAHATAPLANAVVTASIKTTGYDGAITVVAYTGAAPSVGASATAGAKTGAASVKLTTTAAGSQIWAAGHDWTHAAAQTALPGQSLVEQNLDTRVGDTYWVEQSAAIPTAGPVTFGSSAPTTDRWELAAVEVRAAG
jgi:hypothetical protein